MPVVTIGREYGAGGETVGHMVAARLGTEFADRSLMERVATRLNLTSQDVETHDEQPGTLLDRLLTALGSTHLDLAVPLEVAAWVPPHADPAFDPRKAVLNVTQQVILEAARIGNVVVVGRAAAFLLRDHRDATHVFLRAPAPARVRSVMSVLGVGEGEAARRVRETDANRAAYVRQIYGHDWIHPSHYDLVIDTDRLGYAVAAAAIVAVATARSLSPIPPTDYR
ncbi:MAG: AAA family ATPase [Candidatus Dormibacteraceae bacterium]